MIIPRRTFIGILGGTLAAAYTTEWSLVTPTPLAPSLRGNVYIDTMLFLAPDGPSDIAWQGRVSRDDGACLLVCGVAPGHFFQWRAPVGHEFILREGDGLIFEPTDERSAWRIGGRDADGLFTARGVSDRIEEVTRFSLPAPIPE